MGAFESISDDELSGRLPFGNQAEIKEAYIRYRTLLLGYARKMLGDDALAEDTVSDVFAHLLTNQRQLNIKTSLESYLYRSVKNSILDQFDKNQHRLKYVNSIKAYYEKGEYATDEQVMEHEMVHRLDAAVATFPPKMREIFELSRKENRSRKEIAALTNVTEGTVNTQLNRALKILRSKLTAWFI
jgi:RNA polymerase sigma-70 factor, ECF subfamily